MKLNKYTIVPIANVTQAMLDSVAFKNLDLQRKSLDGKNVILEYGPVAVVVDPIHGYVVLDHEQTLVIVAGKEWTAKVNEP
jgi:hypothetical protein